MAARGRKTSKASSDPAQVGAIDDIDVGAELSESFLAYSMSVIVSRALPDARDGLKPVHRRILYSMRESGLRPDGGYVKSARIVGSVMGRYHPHGDAAIYAAMVRLAQDFQMGLPLVDGHGNFGTLTDSAAAARYTEARLSPAAMEMTDGLDEDTVDMADNYDGRLKEPTVLPSAFPNLLVNGTNGIAVGMSTRILPHNLREVCSAVIALLRDPGISAGELADLVGGPDLPSGGVLYGREGARASYLTGRGQVTVGPAEEIVVDARGRASLVFTELPYQVAAEDVMAAINDLIRDGKLPDVVRVADLTDRKHGTRLVVDLRKGADADRVRRFLHRRTSLQSTYHLHHLALIDGVPVTATLPVLLRSFADHRIDVVTRRTRFRRDKAAARLHIVEGLLAALADIDAVVAVIRSAQDTRAAREALAQQFTMSDVQVNAVLEMPLRRLTSLETSTLQGEADDLRRTVAALQALLDDQALLVAAVCDELAHTASAYGCDRRTAIVDPETPDASDDPSDAAGDSPADPLVCIVDGAGMLTVAAPGAVPGPDRRSPGARLAVWADRSPLAWFTDSGHIVYTKLASLPEPGTTTRVDALVDLDVGEAVVGAACPGSAGTLVLVTSTGRVKRLAPAALPKRAASVIRLDEGETLVAAFPADADGSIVVASDSGLVWRGECSAIPVKGAGAGPVAGMRLDGAKVLAAGPAGEQLLLSTVSDIGDVHVCPTLDFPAKGRGGKGVRGHVLRSRATALTGGWIGAAGENYTATARTVKPGSAKTSGRGRAGSPSGGTPLWWPTRPWDPAR